MINDALGIIFDILLGTRIEFMTGAIGVTDASFKTDVILLEKIDNWVGFAADSVRDFQITRTGTFALVARDGALVVNVNPNHLLEKLKKGLDYELFIETNRAFKLSYNAKLLRPVGNFASMIWENNTQFVINNKYQVIAGGPVKGLVLPTINEDDPGKVTTVVFDGNVVKVQRGLEPLDAIPIDNPLIERFIDINI